MAYILHIETSTKLCSLALSQEGSIIFDRINTTESSHASCLGIYVQEAVEYVRNSGQTIDAISVSAGPGSYTGLRIGVSTAKGLCYALGIPMIAIPSLKIMASHFRSGSFLQEKNGFLCPMIDARRMEVYAAIYDKNLALIRDTQADIVNENTYQNYLEQGKVFFFGNGAEKCQAIIRSTNAIFIENIHPLASAMIPLAEEAFHKKEFVDVAYFEPFYLKEFQATVAKKLL